MVVLSASIFIFQLISVNRPTLFGLCVLYVPLSIVSQNDFINGNA